MNDPAGCFAQDKYQVLRSLLKGPLLSLCYRYVMDMAKRGSLSGGAWQMPNTPSAYGHPLMEMLLERLLPEVERAAALRLYPTYSFFRAYQRGDSLARHRDRPACEISLSLSLGYEADAAWPLWIEAPGGVVSVTLEPGDAVLYQGRECFHWRDAFEGEHAAQVFLHYVDQNGPYAEWKFDKRPSLGAAQSLLDER